MNNHAPVQLTGTCIYTVAPTESRQKPRYYLELAIYMELPVPTVDGADGQGRMVTLEIDKEFYDGLRAAGVNAR